jgi:hypothetical protein
VVVNFYGKEEENPMLNAERIRWIERWCEGWENSLDPNAYETMPLSVAIGFVRELLDERDSRCPDCGSETICGCGAESPTGQIWDDFDGPVF